MALRSIPSALFIYLALTAHTFASGGDPSSMTLGTILPLYAVIPFIGILLSIALFPLIAPHFWHHRFPLVSAFWALLFAVPFLFYFGSTAVHEILHIYFIDYIPFIILLWSLYTVAGGIVIRGSLHGTPVLNLVLLLIGTVIASLVGTTGASMLLIRPLLRANKNRVHQVHIIVFFIFLVSNIGGSLTPLGDPPLFLGFLHSVPFFWTLHLIPHMGFAVLILTSLFFAIDTYFYKKESLPPDTGTKVPIQIVGSHNILFLAGIVGSVLMSGIWHGPKISILGIHIGLQNIIRDLLMISMGFLALKTTPQTHRDENEFSWFPIKEVAYLFAGIFMTIIPALAILKAGTEGSLAFIIAAVKEPIHYFWVTGTLSSFLDNAPTYLTFFNTALGNFYANIPEADAVPRLIAENNIFLQAIAAGAVFMGANTYIGNAPNFMVRSIAEENGIPMPSFFGYMLKYAVPILIPTFILVTVVFFI